MSQIHFTLSMSEDICNRMLANISNGIWKEGEKIPSESSLCRMFQASRVSIRSAIKLLQGQGFLITRPGIGSFVQIPRNELGISLKPESTPLSEQSCRDFVDFRLLVEGEAMKLFGQNATQENYDELKAAVDDMYDTSRNKDAFIDADIRFHLAIFKGSKNEYLYTAMLANFQMVKNYIVMVLTAMEEPFQSQMHTRHEAIYLDLLNGQINSAVMRLNTELNYCYVEIFDMK